MLSAVQWWVTVDLAGDPTHFEVRWSTPEGPMGHREALPEGATMREALRCVQTVLRVAAGGGQI